jgi:hypothetical protein
LHNQPRLTVKSQRKRKAARKQQHASFDTVHVAVPATVPQKFSLMPTIGYIVCMVFLMVMVPRSFNDIAGRSDGGKVLQFVYVSVYLNKLPLLFSYPRQTLLLNAPDPCWASHYGHGLGSAGEHGLQPRSEKGLEQCYSGYPVLLPAWCSGICHIISCHSEPHGRHRGRFLISDHFDHGGGSLGDLFARHT